MVQKKAFPLRINEDIWLAVRRWSDDELRSVNGQIEYLLRDALRKAGRMPKGLQQNKNPSGVK
ncbi:MAG: Arc family DNA binding domain-containing protein [Xanthomonadales bacterium]|nr:Arc family DNA binding domain-containing protein [Xanthomonadales bacterium]